MTDHSNKHGQRHLAWGMGPWAERAWGTRALFPAAARGLGPSAGPGGRGARTVRATAAAAALGPAGRAREDR